MNYSQWHWSIRFLTATKSNESLIRLIGGRGHFYVKITERADTMRSIALFLLLSFRIAICKDLEINQIVDVCRFALALAFLWFIQQFRVQIEQFLIEANQSESCVCVCVCVVECALTSYLKTAFHLDSGGFKLASMNHCAWNDTHWE